MWDRGLPRDCSVSVPTLKGATPRICTAGARWVLVVIDQDGIMDESIEFPVCSVHRGAAMDSFSVHNPDLGWHWYDRRAEVCYPAHWGCLSSLGRRQTCQAAGAPSRVVCPLTARTPSESPQGPDRRETAPH